MSQNFLVTVKFDRTIHTEAEIEAAVREGLQRMAVRAWRERNGSQTWPPLAFLRHYEEVRCTMVSFTPDEEKP
jgi:hypothetical protein